MRRKAVITVLLSREASEMKDKEIETAIKFYLRAEDIPLCEKIERVKVLCDSPG